MGHDPGAGSEGCRPLQRCLVRIRPYRRMQDEEQSGNRQSQRSETNHRRCHHTTPSSRSADPIKRVSIRISSIRARSRTRNGVARDVGRGASAVRTGWRWPPIGRGCPPAAYAAAT
jgi:hypothetical protein